MQIGSLLRGINAAVWLLGDRLTFPVSIGDSRALYVVTSPRLVISAYRSSGKTATLSLDLRHSQYRAVATSAEVLEKSYKLHMFRGVLDGVFESEIIGSLFSGAGGSADVGPGAYSTSQVFELAQQAGIRPILLQGSSTEERPSLTQDALSRIDSDLADGNLIVMPEKSVAVGGANHTAWWRVNRTTGETVGVTEDGLHQATTEYVVVEEPDGSYTAYRLMGDQGQSEFFIKNRGALNAWLRGAELLKWGVSRLPL
jgi:hypothetical protein